MKQTAYIVFCLLVFSCTSVKREQPQEGQCSEYACPMHPDKTDTKESHCPQCGIQMEPVVADSSAGG